QEPQGAHLNCPSFRVMLALSPPTHRFVECPDAVLNWVVGHSLHGNRLGGRQGTIYLSQWHHKPPCLMPYCQRIESQPASGKALEHNRSRIAPAWNGTRFRP